MPGQGKKNSEVGQYGEWAWEVIRLHVVHVVG